MPEHDLLNGLAHELLALPARDRRIIMTALTPAERSRVETLLAPSKTPPKEMDLDDQLAEGYSALIAGRIRAAKSDPSAPQRNWKMTAAARRQLLLSAQDILETERVGQKPPARPPSRSLLSALGGWLAGSAPR